MSVGAIIGIVILGLVLVVLVIALRGMVNIVQQGQVGVVRRLGEYRRTHEPGLVIVAPFIEKLTDVDMREIPRPGDRQEVITKDNVVVTVNATIFTQVVDAKQALFSVANFDVAIDALARTALRSVIGTMTLDEALSERERINTDVQEQMEVVTDKWGIRISRIEIVEITPPPQILQALALQKQADQEKRARILQSEGQQQSAINVAEGEAQAAVRAAEGERQAAILRAQGNKEAAILEADGRAHAIERVYSAIAGAKPDPTLVAILQLDTLAKFADSDNSTVVVPYESAGLLGAAQALKSVLASVPTDGVLAPPGNGSSG
ncbi:MAG TPA: SPFH domain-containing protein [Acidimicrobiales bacterium]|nr:SPFH domain-containing protein [Acidimicrobiales bacterium]